MQPSFSSEIDINGARLHIAVTGDGAAVVLLHSGITDSSMWEPQLEAFAAHYRVINYDLRGFGRSTIPPHEYAHDEDLRSLLDAIGVDTAMLVGASYGGEVALAFAVEYPARVDALVLVNTLAGITEPSPALRSGWQAVDDALGVGLIDDAVELELRMWVDGPHRSAADVNRDVRERVRTMDTALLRRADEQAAATEREPDRPVLDRLGGIDVPVLLVVGTLDGPDALASADVLVAGIAGARRFDIPGAAHLPSMECPADFNAGVLAFMRDVSTAY